MDLNYLFLRHQTSLMRANSTGCVASRKAHAGLAQGYAHRIDALQRQSGAAFPLTSKAAIFVLEPYAYVLALCRRGETSGATDTREA